MLGLFNVYVQPTYPSALVTYYRLRYAGVTLSFLKENSNANSS